MADAQGATSEFDSDEFADDEQGGDLVDSAAAIGRLNALMQDGSILQKMQELQARMLEEAPQEIREAEERMRVDCGTAADMQRYQAWAMQQMPKHMAAMRSVLGGLFAGDADRPVEESGSPGDEPRPTKHTRKRSRAEQAAWQRRYAALRPLLVAGVAEEQLQAVLKKQALFAEESLAAFLPLLGIDNFFANLSYRYLDETREAELAAHGTAFVHHLRFATNGL